MQVVSMVPEVEVPVDKEEYLALLAKTHDALDVMVANLMGTMSEGFFEIVFAERVRIAQLYAQVFDDDKRLPRDIWNTLNPDFIGG